MSESFDDLLLPQPSAASRKRIGIAVAAIVSTIAVVASARYDHEQVLPAPKDTGMSVSAGTLSLAPGAPQWASLRLGRVTAADAGWTDPVPAFVKIDETRSAKLGTLLAGRVVRVFVELGQSVEAGDPLFTVASPEIADLEAQARTTAVELQSAEENRDRVHALVEARALAAKEDAAARRQWKQAEVGHHLAEQKLGALRVDADGTNRFTVRAPRKGVIVELSVVAEQQVAPDASHPLVVVADLDSVWVMADVLESEARRVHVGSQARIELPGETGPPLTGSVVGVSAWIDPDRHSVPIRVSAGNPGHELRPNRFLHVSFGVQADPGEVDVPATALVSSGDRQYVYVQDADGLFVRREVTTGTGLLDRTPVRAGLKPGETIVEDGALLLDNQIGLSQ